MEKPKQSWTDFVRRRRLNVVEWLKSKGLDTAEKLQKWCRDNDMEEPKEDVLPKKEKPEVKFVPVEDIEIISPHKEVVPEDTETVVQDKPKRGRKKKEESSSELPEED